MENGEIKEVNKGKGKRQKREQNRLFSKITI
jgi:hypothetical protein